MICVPVIHTDGPKAGGGVDRLLKPAIWGRTVIEGGTGEYGQTAAAYRRRAPDEHSLVVRSTGIAVLGASVIIRDGRPGRKRTNCKPSHYSQGQRTTAVEAAHSVVRLESLSRLGFPPFPEPNVRYHPTGGGWETDPRACRQC